jgi:hypothetical protein
MQGDVTLRMRIAKDEGMYTNSRGLVRCNKYVSLIKIAF